MNQTLYFEIAGHTVAVETPDPERALQFMDNYEPFRMDRDAINGVSTEPVLHFSLGNHIDIPDVTPADFLEDQGILSTVYITDEAVFATTEFRGVTRNMKASRDWKRAETDVSLTDAREVIFFKGFLTTAFGMATAPLKTIKIHASAIEKEGKSLLFLGVSGTGKSTHSRLWLEHVEGCSLLNDDEPIVRLMPDGSVRVYGAPWSGSTPCYKNRWAEVTAFVHLRQSAENRLKKLSAAEAFSSVLVSVSMFRSVTESKALIMDTIFGILNAVPVYRLDCRPDEEAARLSETLLSS